ncbi:hypothetical protein VitviT2T_001179 [Vitis vinifera]|uniref:GAG-pre-integrase domain-containing protein n=1 Tax=Vitis vinifera TaxID=29760 RepID=A0ABY9BF08_VITVI|nr:hypothetical protein VitviT2T_001179 [Vitis vinifera]
MGNDGSDKAISMGDVRLETSNGTMLILKNVKHILDIRMNLISTGKLDDEGFCNTFRDSQWKLTRVDDDSTVELWHNKLDHMNEKGLMILAKKNLFSDMKKGSLKRCAHCLAGKQTRVAFKTHRHTRKPSMLDLVYSDKKLVKSRDVMSMEDHTIQNIKKTDVIEFQYRDNAIDFDPVPLTHLPTHVEDEAHDDQPDIGDVETPTQVEMDDDVHEQSPVAEAH